MFSVISYNSGVKDKTSLTMDEAENYIKEHICRSCLNALKDGHYPNDSDYKIYLPSQTDCGANFSIISDAEYLDLTKGIKK